jgi:ADP-heptose:LPS heptosyltransferase
MRILALVPGGISDQLLFFPTLEDIKKAYPNAEIAVAAEPKATPAYRVSKIVNTLLPFAFSDANSPSDWANLLGLIRDREYEVAITSNTRWGTGLLLWLSGVPTRVTYSSTVTPWFYTNTVPDHGQNQRIYQAKRYHDLLSAIDLTGPTPPPTINVPEGDIAWANALRDRLNLKNGYVLMYPGPATGQGDGLAAYPTASWQTLIADFRAKQPQLPVVLLQTDDSTQQVTELKQSNPDITIAPAANLGQSAALIAGADLVISPDSHITQLAVALKVFTLSLFGRNHPEEMLPPAEGEETRFLGILSDTGRLSDIDPKIILQKIWGNR